MEPLGVAVIGCGHWGTNLVRTLNNLGVLAAIVEENDSQADLLTRQFGCARRTMAEVLSDPNISAVAIATPAATHFQVAMDCLAARKHVFVEKPMSLDPHHASELVQKASQLNLTLMVGHLLNYHPVFERLMELIQSGFLGRLRYVYSNRLNLGKIRREEDILWSFAPHDISMILKIAAEAPDNVQAVGTFALHERIADVTTTHLSFPSGLRAHVFVSWLHPLKEQKLVVVGDRAMAVFDDRASWDRKLALFEDGVTWESGVPQAKSVEPSYIEVAESEPLTNEMQHFLHCVSTGATPTTDGHEGLRVLRVLSAATDQLLASSVTKDPARVGIDETAVIDDGVTVGPNTKVYHFSHIISGSTVGANCTIGQNVVIGPNVHVGSGCKIQNNVSIYDGVTLEENVFCGPSMVFTNVATPRASVSRKNEFMKTIVRAGASIGANATIVCGNNVGRYALVGAGAVVTKDVPDHALVMGVPASQVGWVSETGEVLGDDLVCPRTGDQYELVEGALRRKGGGS